MGFCKDQSTTFLKGLGYNVVRLPESGLGPLTLVGVQNKSTLKLGPLDLLITNPPGPLPVVRSDIAMANVSGQRTSKLDIGVGLDILGGIIGAMGGNLEVKAQYSRAQKVQFTFNDVLSDEVTPLEVGRYLSAATVDQANLVLEQYVLGDGQLYLITKTLRSKKFTVTSERKDGAGVELNVPVVQQVVGASVKVSAASESSATISYEGTSSLTFGFQAFIVGVVEGDLSIASAQAGSIAMVAAGQPAAPVILGDGLLRAMGR